MEGMLLPFCAVIITVAINANESISNFFIVNILIVYWSRTKNQTKFPAFGKGKNPICYTREIYISICSSSLLGSLNGFV